MDFGSHIKELREAKELSIRELARKADLSPSHLHYIESGRTMPGDETVGRLAKALATSKDRLLQERDLAKARRTIPEDVTLLLAEDGPLTPEKRQELLEAAEVALREMAKKKRPDRRRKGSRELGPRRSSRS